MKRTIFIFSSPLQFLFSGLISNTINKDSKIEAYYYSYGKDFYPTYSLMLNYVDTSINQINHIDNLRHESISNTDEVFIGNRYNIIEVALFYKLRNKTEKIYLYEEGFNIYIKHHFNNIKQSEFNIITNLKNTVKLLIGRTPSLIKLSKFRKVYTTFPLDHLRDQSKREKIIFLSKNRNTTKNYTNSCLFLSQTLVEDGFINDNSFLKFMNQAFKQLEEKYALIYFKPHPRNSEELISRVLQSNKKVSFLPDDYQQMPAELFLINNTIDVYGFSSSTLLYASGLFNINTYQCMNQLLECVHTPKLEDFYNSVVPLFKKYGIIEFSIKKDR
jgi:hypothetical protein